MKALIYSSVCTILLCLSVQRSSFAQVSSVSIGTETVKDKAVLWLKGNGSQGLLLPVVNRSSFTGLNNSDEKGMLIFDPTDNKVYFWNGSTWVECGGGSTAANQTLTLNGNTFTLTGSPASNVQLANNAPAVGQALVWNGTAWTAATLTGDVTGSVTASQVSGIKGKTIPTLPATTQALVYNGTAWTFQALTGGTDSQDLTLSGKVLSLTNDATSVTLGDLAIVNAVSGGSTGTITDGSIQDVDIANATITAGKLAASGATSGQVLKYNGTNWAPAADAGTTYTAGTGISITGTTIANTGDTNAADDLTTATSASGDVTGLFSNLQIATDAVTTTEIANGTITDADIANVAPGKITQAAATSGQVLKWNGTAWAPGADDVGGGATPTLSNGQILTGNGTTNAASTLGGDATLSGGTLTIAANAIGTSEITDGSITTNDISDGTIRDTDIAEVAPSKILQAAATTGQTLKWNGTAWAPADDTGGTTYTAGTGISITGSTIANTGDTNAADDVTTASTAGGDLSGTFNNLQIAAGTVTTTEIANATIATADIATGAVTTASIADGTISAADLATGAVTSTVILDGTIAAADLNAMSATNGQVLKYNGTAWAPAADAGGTTYTAGTGIDVTGSVITNTGDTNAADDLTTASTAGGDLSGTFTNLQIAAGAVTTTEIANATIATADLATGAVTSAIILDGTVADADIAAVAPGKLTQAAATSGQVLKWNGTAWAPAADGGTTYTAGTGIDITGTTVTNTGDTNAGDDLTTASNAAGDVTGAFSNLQIASGVVTTTEIANATIATADLATGAVTSAIILDGTVADADIASVAPGKLTQAAATSGQVLKWNGTAWAPAADDAGISTTLTSANILVGNGSNVATPVLLSGDATLNNTGVLTISNGAISGGTGGKITDASITSADLANGSVSGGTGGVITDASITGADLASNISISTTGNIATTGTGTLTVAGATTLSTLGGSGAQMVVVDNAGLLSKQALPTAGWNLTGNTGTNPATNFVGTTDAQPLLLSTNATERMRINTSGNVGIGVDPDNYAVSDQASLEIYRTGVSSRFRLMGATADNQSIQFYGTDGTTTSGWAILRRGSDQSFRIQRNTALGSGQTDFIYIQYATGNLGIQNSNPSEALDVTGNVRFSGALLPNNLAGTAGQVLTSTGAGSTPVWSTVSGSALSLNNVIPKGNGTGQIASSLTDNGTTVSTTLDFNIATGKAFKINNVNILRLNAAGTLFVGESAGAVNDAGAFNNTFVGYRSGYVNTTGSENTFYGSQSGIANVDGAYNTFVGRSAGGANTSGNLNTFLGFRAGRNATTVHGNTFIGADAGLNTTGSGTTGGLNVFVGEQAGLNNSIGYQNVFIGRYSGTTNTTGMHNIIIGADANMTANNLDNAIAIGFGASVSANNNVVIGNGNIVGWGFGTQPIAGRAIVVGTSSSNGNGAYLTTGGIWTNASDRNKKENFQTVDNEEILMKVKALPITRWNYIGESKTNTHIGPMAQDFYTLFQTGDDDKTISTIDPSGVAIASIQALLKRIEDLQKENELLKSEKGVLESKVTSIEQQQQSLQKDVEELKRILGLLANNK